MGGESILIVDDDATLRETVYMSLQAGGYRVMMARGGVEGLKMARTLTPDLILLDYQLGDIDGTEVIESLNRRQIDIPVILMTAHGSEMIAVDVFRRGVKDYLIKPFRDDELLASVERGLTEARLRRQNAQLTESLTVMNARLNQRVHELDRRLRELRILFGVGKSITAMIQPDELLVRVVGAATMLTYAGEASLYVLDGRDLVRRAVKLPSDKRPRPDLITSTDSLALEAIRGKRIADENASGGKAGLITVGLAAPMILGGEPVGALVVRRPARGSGGFSTFDRELLSALSDFAAVAVGSALSESGGGMNRPATRPLSDGKGDDMVFVSYSHQDWEPYVRALVRRLDEAGFNPWVDQDIREKGGVDWMDTINDMLENSRFMVLCVTPNALESSYVRMEYRYFFHRKKPIIPVICEPVMLPAELYNIHNISYDAPDLLIKRLNDLVAGR